MRNVRRTHCKFDCNHGDGSRDSRCLYCVLESWRDDNARFDELAKTVGLAHGPLSSHQREDVLEQAKRRTERYNEHRWAAEFAVSRAKSLLRLVDATEVRDTTIQDLRVAVKMALSELATAHSRLGDLFLEDGEEEED